MGISFFNIIYRTWRFKLPPIESSNIPTSVAIQNLDSKETIEISDVLFGDVYVCAGQSNMQQAVYIYIYIFQIIIVVLY